MRRLPLSRSRWHHFRMGTVDDYLAELDPIDASAIERIYRVARELVPDVEQGTSYGMPALLYRGRPLISIKRTKKHIGVYPFSPEAVSAVVAAHDSLDFDKGTVRFQPETPLPDALLTTLVTIRRDQIDAATGS